MPIDRALAILLLASASWAQTVTVHPSTIAGVTMTGPQDPQYSSAVDQILGPVRPPSMNNWLPYGVVVDNGSTQRVVAIAVRWTATNAQGQPHQYTLTFDAFGRADKQINPAQSVVGLACLTLLDGPPRANLESLYRSRSGKLAEIQASKNIEISLDGVVYASGQFVGPDTMQEFELWQAETTTVPQVAGKVMAMKAAGEGTASVIAWLHSTAALERSKDLSQRHTGRAARGLFQAYDQKGEAFFYQVAESEAKPLIQLSRE